MNSSNPACLNDLSLRPSRNSLVHAPFRRYGYPDSATCIIRIGIGLTQSSDVISLRARPSGSRIKYRVVDEYATEFLLPQQTSRRPFSLRQLIRFLDSVEQPGADAAWKRSGFVLSYNECNLDCGTDLEAFQDFTSVSSDFYPDLASHYCHIIEDWYLAQEQAIEEV